MTDATRSARRGADASLESPTGRLADRLAITDVLTAYASAIDTRDFAAVRACFTADATLDYTSVGGPRGSVEEVVGWLERMLTPILLTQHLLTNHRITLGGDTARAEVQLVNPFVAGSADEPTVLLFGGRYEDRLRRTADGWRITEQVQVTTWQAGPLPGSLTTPPPPA